MTINLYNSQEIPSTAREMKLESETEEGSDLKVVEYETEEVSSSYLEAEEFNNMLGYTLEDICEWLDDRYQTSFQSTKIDSFEYGDGYILLSRQKTNTEESLKNF